MEAGERISLRVGESPVDGVIEGSRGRPGSRCRGKCVRRPFSTTPGRLDGKVVILANRGGGIHEAGIRPFGFEGLTLREDHTHKARDENLDPHVLILLVLASGGNQV